MSPALLVTGTRRGIGAATARVDEMSWARLERMMRINLLGSIACAREAMRRMSTLHGGTGGRIINVSNEASCLGAPSRYMNYAAAKGAIDTDIHASGGLPNRIKDLQPLVPAKRGGTAEEVAQAIV